MLTDEPAQPLGIGRARRRVGDARRAEREEVVDRAHEEDRQAQPDQVGGLVLGRSQLDRDPASVGFAVGARRVTVAVGEPDRRGHRRAGEVRARGSAVRPRRSR